MSVLSSILFKEPIFVASAGASGGFESDGRPTVYKRALNLIDDRAIQTARLYIAPLDANTLTKLANGLADNCLTCT